MNTEDSQPCPFCLTIHPAHWLVGGSSTLPVLACPHAGKLHGKSSGAIRNVGEELRILQARVETLGRELGLALKLLHDHGLALHRLVKPSAEHGDTL